MRIFLSYGHDGNEYLIRRIKADLENRGHDVWFDKSEIKFGDEWRRAITDGILQSNRVLSFLSKHSTRDPGVCLDEIAIAIGVKGGNIQTILVESEREVNPPPSISHIQWLDMHDWQEHRATDESAWEPWYQAKLAALVAVVESDESRRFAGEIKTLEDLLKPTASDFASDARIRQLLEKKLVGRTWLFEAVENWRTASKDVPCGSQSRLFWLMGTPGIGKSAFAAHLAHEYGRGIVIAVQFCDWKKPDHRDAGRIIRTLAFQIATRLPDYRKLLLTLPIMTELDQKNSTELFDGLLTNPLNLSIIGGRERYLIVIDALDEAGGDGRNELVEVLARYAQQLPDWIGLVVTSRPEFDVTTPFQTLKPFPFETKSAANSDDIRTYLRHELAVQLRNRPDADRLVEQILEKSEGVFLYVESFCEDIRKNYLSLDRPNEFPQGLAGKFFMGFQRYFPDLEKFRKDVRPALRAILAACEPLPLEILQNLLKWRDEELRDFTRPIASLFPVAGEAGHEVIKPFHKSLADWLTDEGKAGVYYVSKLEGHHLLAAYGWQKYQENARAMPPYCIANLESHLTNAKRYDQLAIILGDFQFLPIRIAAKIHSYWRDLFHKQGEVMLDKFDVPYEHLDQARQYYLRNEVYGILTILSRLGLRLIEITDTNIVPAEAFRGLIENNLEPLAEISHKYWVTSHEENGWRYSKMRKDAKKLHSALLPYVQLSRADKDRERNSVRKIPDFIAEAGLAVAKINDASLRQMADASALPHE